MTGHRRGLTGPEAAVAAFAITGTVVIVVAALVVSPAVLLGLILLALVWGGGW